MQTVAGFQDMLRQYTEGNILYVFVMLSGIFYIYQEGRSGRRVALLTGAFLLVAVFNPWSYKILTKAMGEDATYYRFLWIFPCEMAVAWITYQSLAQIKNLKHRMAFVCIICLGVLFLKAGWPKWKLPENIYQIPTATVEVATALEELRLENGQEQIRIIADAGICYNIRQFDARICLPFTLEDYSPAEISMLMDNRNDMDVAVVLDFLNANSVDYLVLGIHNEISLSYMQQTGWEIVATTPAYHILQYKAPAQQE